MTGETPGIEVHVCAEQLGWALSRPIGATRTLRLLFNRRRAVAQAAMWRKAQGA